MISILEPQEDKDDKSKKLPVGRALRWFIAIVVLMVWLIEARGWLLIPMIALATCAIMVMSFGKLPRWQLGQKFKTVIILATVCIGLWGVFKYGKKFMPTKKTLGSTVTAMDPMDPVVCEDEAKTEADHSKEKVDRLVITLHNPGCFSGHVTLPGSWKAWRAAPVGSDKGGWLVLWFKGDPLPMKPLLAGQWFTRRDRLLLSFRLEGKEGERMLFYKVR